MVWLAVAEDHLKTSTTAECSVMIIVPCYILSGNYDAELAFIII